MIIGCMCISKRGMLHQSRNAACDGALFPIPTAAHKDILEALAELEHGGLGGVGLGKVVRVAQHLEPVVAEEVVDCAAGADDEVAVVAEGGDEAAHPGVQVRVESGVHADDGRRGAFVGEHADEDEERVVDPVKGLVWAGV